MAHLLVAYGVCMLFCVLLSPQFSKTHSSGGMIETKLPKRIVCVDNADFWSTVTLMWNKLAEGIHGVMNDCLYNSNLKYGTFGFQFMASCCILLCHYGCSSFQLCQTSIC